MKKIVPTLAIALIWTVGGLGDVTLVGLLGQANPTNDHVGIEGGEVALRGDALVQHSDEVVEGAILRCGEGCTGALNPLGFDHLNLKFIHRPGASRSVSHFTLL